MQEFGFGGGDDILTSTLLFSPFVLNFSFKTLLGLSLDYLIRLEDLLGGKIYLWGGGGTSPFSHTSV